MSTVREAALNLLRSHDMTTVFGNPGSTELAFLHDLPGDFRYVLGLQEATVVGMADGYAQASGRPTIANLHTTPGVGNAIGAIFNARANRAPVVVLAGQQARSLMTLEANLTNREATRLPEPLVKWSFEPPRAQDVPHALARAIHTASLPPTGPVFLSVPMDDWAAEVPSQAGSDVAHLLDRSVHGRAIPDADAILQLAERLHSASRPALIAGPQIDAGGGWRAAVSLAERLALPVYASPATGGGRIGFPEDHPLFQGILPPAVGPLGEALAGHDLVLAVGTSVFPYYPDLPGPLLAPGTVLVAVTDDPDEAARAPMGEAIVADPALTLAALSDAVGPSHPDRPTPPMRPAPAVPPEGGPVLHPSAVAATLARALPADAIVVVESPSATLALRNQLRISRPASWYFSAGGGLGFGMPAALGVKLACPSRPVICVVGEGSAQYSIQSLWTAATHGIDVTFVVLRNDEYAIVRWFGQLQSVDRAPGLDIPSLDCVALASAYGVQSSRATDRDQLAECLADALAAGGPRLVEVAVAPGMAVE